MHKMFSCTWNVSNVLISSIKFAWYILLRLFVLFVYFVLFVMVRSLGPCVPRSRAWYHWKALGKEGCPGFVLQHSNLWWESYGFSKFLWVIKIKKLILFTFWMWQPVCFFPAACLLPQWFKFGGTEPQWPNSVGVSDKLLKKTPWWQRHRALWSVWCTWNV